MGFRSGLEEKVADLMVELDVKYEYESTKIPYEIQFNYTPDFCYQMVSTLNVRDTGKQRIGVRSRLSNNNTPVLIYVWFSRHHITRLVRRVKLPTHNGVIVMTYHGLHFITFHSTGSPNVKFA